MSDWRYFATRLNGDGTESLVHPDLPLSGVSVRQVLSGPNTLSGNITPADYDMMTREATLFEAWSTAIYAECDGEIRGGGILRSEPVMHGINLRLEAEGFSGYPRDMPWTAGLIEEIDTDPATLIAEVWGHLLNAPHGNLGLDVEVEQTLARVGTEDEPFVLSWWDTHDLGAALEDLASSGTLDWVESHRWGGAAGDEIIHSLRYSAQIGRRNPSLRFVIGENIIESPPFGEGELPYASEVLAIGAGEGEEMLRATRSRNRGRLRRVAVVPDKSLTTSRQVAALAERELGARSGEWGITEFTAINHPNTPIGSFGVGDEVFVDAGVDWSDGLSAWHRILAIDISPDNADTVKVSTVRV